MIEWLLELTQVMQEKTVQEYLTKVWKDQIFQTNHMDLQWKGKTLFVILMGFNTP